MTSTAGDPHPPTLDVHRTTISGDRNDEKVQKLQNPVTLPEIDRLGFRNETDVNDGDTAGTAVGKLKAEVAISPDRSGLVNEDEDEVTYDGPPGLTTLNVNGRPRFELVTVRENGRLQMFMVPNRSPQLVRSPGRNGRLKMWLLHDGQRGGDRAVPPVRRSV